ncbi:protein-glutamate methylesterase/protein-glutamine glutaminase [Shewanella zhangzhouensis]|uniref:protein-glutamate methylesterase/protein-glutamine glutaminase n=1 Tax=Shewanella zhangzhouensis TaxID=2864213 RepID=UPI001C656F24|nr:chemotaxis response regulator protein-glutamate methylesterase [Shewanella zhangzhouensis]QYK03553.1 chemotaxis response regulator protein-glutamate methylesterase [Shewanella zhangzhouensis]
MIAKRSSSHCAEPAIKVMVVDDSAVVRQVLTQILNEDHEINVIASVSDPIFAMKRMENEWPDVIILDVEMPRMDGITFLKKIMSERPTPVVICSTLTEKGAETTLQALQAGAVNIITKPRVGLKDFLLDGCNDVVSAVKAASTAKLSNINASKNGPPKSKSVIKHISTRLSRTTQKVVAIGTSTGGTQALEAILSSLPSVTPGIVIVQHMPEKFTEMFAKRLDSICEIEVREAVNKDRVLPGLALIAPGGRHMRLKRSGAHYLVEIFDGPVVNRHKPSVDVLFRSVADQAGSNAAGFILTGMGDDGARGLNAMRQAGAYTVAQDEASCIVFGMPKEAIALGAAQSILPLNKIANEIMSSLTAEHL